MSFAKKVIQLSFQLQTGTFNGTQSNNLTVSGKIHVHMEDAGGVSSNAVRIAVWGLTQSQMNQLSTFGTIPTQNLKNTVTVLAGDEGALTQIFTGIIQFANADLSGQPDAALVITAFANLYTAVAPVAPVSYSGPTDAAQIMTQLAAKWQPKALTLQNHGVSVKLSNPYLSGSVWDMARSVARAGNFNIYPDLVRGTLDMWPQNGNRGNSGITIGPGSGLVGYPTFGIGTIQFTTLFNPGLINAKQVQLKSSLPNASKLVTPMNITTDLQAETPNGAWFQSVYALTGDFAAGS